MKDNLQVRIYNEMKRKILNCEYLPGYMLKEETLSIEYNVSRTPIREAVSRLAQEELVIIKPKKGIIVAPITIEDINQTYEVRLLFECYAVSQYGPSIDKNKLLECLSELNELKESDFESDEVYILDDKVHKTIMDAIDNQYILNTYKSLHSKNTRYRFFSGSNNKNRLKESTEEHLEIVKACIEEDWTRASEALRNHIFAAKKVTFDFLYNHYQLISTVEGI